MTAFPAEAAYAHRCDGIKFTGHQHDKAVVTWFFVLTAAAYNLMRIPKILAATR